MLNTKIQKTTENAFSRILLMSRRVLGLSCSVALMLLLWTAAQAQQNTVTVYEHSDFQGASQTFGVGIYDSGKLNIVGNDKISSIKVSPGLKVKVCEHRNCGGQQAEFTADAVYVGDALNDKISWIEVTQPKVTAFVDDQFQGASQSFSVGTYNGAQLTGVGNDQISSLRVPAGLEVKVCQHDNEGGNCQVLTADTNYVGDLLNDEISYLKVSSRSIGSSPPPADGVQAKMADSLIDKMAYTVNVWDGAEAIFAKVNELGIRRVRFGPHFPDGNSHTFNDPNYARTILQRYNLKLMVIGCNYGSNTVDQLKNWIKSVGKEYVLFVEGCNEPEWQHDNNNPNWLNDMKQYQINLYDSFKADPDLRTIRIAGPSPGSWAGYEQWSDLGSKMDCINVHDYEGGNAPERSDKTPVWGQMNAMGGNKCIVAGEFGYTNAIGYDPNHGSDTTGYDSQAVPEEVSGIYMPRAYLLRFNLGYDFISPYSFKNQFEQDDSSHENNFGIVDQNLIPKPAFTAVQNLITLVQDQGATFTPGKLNYSLSDTNNVSQTLLQKRNGEFILAVWDNTSIFKTSDRGENRIRYPDPHRNITINLGQAADAAVAYPNNGTNWQTVSTANNRITVDVTSKVALVRIKLR